MIGADPSAGRAWLPADADVRRVMIASLAVSCMFWFWLAQQRAGVRDPYALTAFRRLLLYEDFHAFAPFLAVLAAATFGPFRRAGARVAAFCGERPVTVAVATGVALLVGTRLVYHWQPLSMDEYAPLFQSHAFVAGKLAGRFPPELIDSLIPKGLQGNFLLTSHATGAVSSVYWPGLSLLEVPFTALGAPWLLNPLVGAATVVVMHRLALALFSDRVDAGFVVLFTMASTAVTINALSYYSMPAHLLASALFSLLLIRPTPGRAALAGLVGSIALVLHNPVPHMLFALPWIVWLASRTDRVRLLGALIAGYLPVCLVAGFGWPLYLRSLYNPQVAHASVTAVAGQTLVNKLASVLRMPSDAILAARFAGLAKLWLWAVPGLLAAAALGAWSKRDDRGVWLVLASAGLLTYFGYFLVRFDQGHGWGYRYFHSAWLVLPLFAVAAIRGSPALAGYLGACALVGGIAMTAFQATQVERFISRHLAQLPAAPSGDARVTFIDTREGYYAWDLVQNDPFLRGPLKLVSQGAAADAALMKERFPGYVRLYAGSRGSVWGAAAQGR